MYILTRYAIWEVLKLFLAALFSLTLVLTLTVGMKEGLSRGAPATVMLCAMPFMLPEILGITIPVAMLFSVCSVFGRMTGANEIVALKSLGVSPMAVVWPAIILAAFLSLGTVRMYEIAATWCKPAVNVVLADSIEEIIYSVLQKNHSIVRDQFSITVKRVDKRMLIRPTITINGPPRVTISAARAELHTDWKTHSLRFIYYDSVVDVEDGKYTATSPGKKEEYVLPIAVPNPPPYHRDYVALGNVPKLIAELQTTKRQLERLREANKALGLAESPEDIEKVADLNHLIFRLRAEPYRRWANGFACLSFALIGIPVAMLWRHADVLTNFFVCFLPILALYYPLLMLSDNLATSGRPPICFWTANVALVAPALFLLRWINRH
jgi:lipopolysaccharide export system permease protein